MRNTLAFGFGVALALCAACQPAAPPPPTRSETKPPAAKEPTAADTARALVGMWSAGPDPWLTLAFDGQGKYTYSARYDGPERLNRHEEGEYAVPEAGRLELRPKGDEPRRYAVRLDGDEMRLEPGEQVWRREKPGRGEN